MVLVDHPDAKVLHLAAEGVAENHQLRDRHKERHDDERRAAAKSAQLAFDDGPHPVHVPSLAVAVDQDRAIGGRRLV